MNATASIAMDEGGARDEPARLARSLGAFAPLIAAALACAIAASIVAPYPVGVFHDDGVYLVLAKSLASGDGYRYLHLPGAPFATHYPPAYPLFLAVIWTIASQFPRDLTIILLANAALLGVAAWGAARYVITQRGWSPVAAAAFALVGAISLPLIQLTTLVMSEVMFLALLFPLLMHAERRVADPRRPVNDVVLGSLAGVLTLVRAHGIVLVVALVVILALRREWKRGALVAAGALLLLLPWQLWVALNDSGLPFTLRGSYGSYVAWLADGIASGGLRFVAGTVTRNAAECAAILADRFAPWPPGLTRIIPLAFVLGLFVLGAWRLRKRGERAVAAPVTTAFVIGYLAVTLLWPYAPWRFVWGVWPLVLLLAIEGSIAVLEYPLNGRTGQLVRYLLRGAVAVLGLGVARAEVVAYRDRAWAAPVHDATWRIAPVMRWINQNTRPHEIVIADAEPLVYLFLNRPALPPVAFTAAEYLTPRSAAADSAALAALVRQYPVRYIVTVVPSTARAAELFRGASSARGPSLRQVDSLPGGAVFEVVRP